VTGHRRDPAICDESAINGVIDVNQSQRHSRPPRLPTLEAAHVIRRCIDQRQAAIFVIDLKAVAGAEMGRAQLMARLLPDAPQRNAMLMVALVSIAGASGSLDPQYDSRWRTAQKGSLRRRNDSSADRQAAISTRETSGCRVGVQTNALEAR
jgi:hypothetical protein